MATLAASWAIIYAVGGAGRVPPHFFYVPILIAGASFGLAGAAVTAAIAGVLAGPLLPLDVDDHKSQPLSDWTSRTGFFIGIGLIMAAVVGRLVSALAREHDVVQRERDLAEHKAAVIQTVSHEFRTPLTVIQGVADTLLKRNLVPREALPLIEGLSNATDRLDRLLKTVLAAGGALGQGDRLEQEPIVLRSFLRRVCGNFPELDASRRVEFVFAAEADTVVSNRELLTAAVCALVENALRFSPPDSAVQVLADREGDTLRVQVIDHGPGIDPDFFKRAVDPFTQGDQSPTREKGGLGLGLFVARRIAELLGGRLELSLAPEAGTRAVLHIPQRRADDHVIPDHQPYRLQLEKEVAVAIHDDS